MKETTGGRLIYGGTSSGGATYSYDGDVGVTFYEEI
jgi:hypothetical protein